MLIFKVAIQKPTVFFFTDVSKFVVKKNIACFWLATWNVKINAITKVFREPPDGCFELRFFSPSVWTKQETRRTQFEGLDPPLILNVSGV